MNPEIAVVGSSNTDMVVKIPSLPAPGETVLGGDFVVAAGGKGANQAVAAARLGAVVGFVARVGCDMFGDQAIESFKADGILTDFVYRDEDRPSGVALIMVDEPGENMIAVASGANGGLTTSDVDKAECVIGESSVLLLQLEVPMEVVRFAVRVGARTGSTVILNPAPAQSLDGEMLRQLSVITPNEKEAATLTGIEPHDAETAQAAAKRLNESGVENVVITMGRQGAFLLCEDYSGLIPAPKVKATDTTAAGDAFNGALAYAMSRKKEMPEAVAFANHVAALSVTRMGAQPSLPTREDVVRQFPVANVQ